MRKYKLNSDHSIEEVTCLKEWAECMERNDRIVKQDQVGDILVSTVFLGIDHQLFSVEGGRPILFETMIFNGIHDQYQERCCTYEQALDMHQDALDLAIEGAKPLLLEEPNGSQS